MGSNLQKHMEHTTKNETEVGLMRQLHGEKALFGDWMGDKSFANFSFHATTMSNIDSNMVFKLSSLILYTLYRT